MTIVKTMNGLWTLTLASTIIPIAAFAQEPPEATVEVTELELFQQELEELRLGLEPLLQSIETLEAARNAQNTAEPEGLASEDLTPEDFTPADPRE